MSNNQTADTNWTPTAKGYRTDRHNNPTAMTTEVAAQGGLVMGKDYEVGDPFKAGDKTYYTARLLGDPIRLTIRVIDAIGFYTKSNSQRWPHTAIPKPSWDALGWHAKVTILQRMYKHEAGTDLQPLFYAALGGDLLTRPERITELAKRAYTSYCAHTCNKSIVTGDALPTWDSLRPDVKLAWEAAIEGIQEFFR